MNLNIKQTIALDYLEDDVTEEVLFGGSAGPGKSTLGCYWQLKNRLKYPGTRGFIGRVEMKVLKDTTLKTFFEVAAMQGLKRGAHYDFTGAHDKESPNCLLFANQSMIYVRDLKLMPADPDFDDLGSLEISDAYVDECSQVVTKAVDILKVRIRYRLNGRKQKILYTTNPTKMLWAYQRFYQAHKKGTIAPYRKFVQAFPADNPALDKNYINSLRMMPEGPDKERLYHGNWEFSDDPTALCPYDAILDLFTNHVEPTDKKAISADLAMQGRDRFVAGDWEGLVVTIAIDKLKATGKEIETDIAKLMQKKQIGHSQTVVDSDGMGAYLESYLKGIKEFHGGATAVDKVEFANLKSECAYKLAEFCNKRQMRIICTPEQQELIVQEMGVLKARSVDTDETRKRIIGKDDMKALLGRSPDYLDMLIMGMMFHVKKRIQIMAG
jgi:hypothetical protein